VRLGISAAAACLHLLGAAAAFAAAPVELDIPVFEGGYGTAFYAQTALQFEAIRPGVRVHIYGDPRIQDQLRVRIIDGNLPDAASVPYILWPELIREGKIVDLRAALQGPNWEGDARWADTFQPGSLDSWRVDQGVYGLPFSYACWSIFYNRGLFKAHGWTEPRTWDAFFALCDRIRAAGMAPVSLPGTRWLYPSAFFRAAYHSLAGPAGWKALNAPYPGAWNDPRVERCAELLRRVTRDDTQAGWEGETAQGAELLFLQGRAAMTVSGSWFFNEMKGKIPEGFEVGTMNFPVFSDGLGDPSTIQTGSDCFFVFKSGDPARQRLTVDFLRFLTSRASAAAWIRQTDAPVAIRGVDASAYSPSMRETAAIIARARDAFAMPQEMMQPPALRQALVDDTRSLMAGRLAPPDYGRMIEAAAADDRMRAAEPGRVDFRHPIAGTALIVGLAVLSLWLFSGRLGPLLRPTLGRPGPAAGEAGGFGRLRAPMAIGFVGPAFLLYAALMLAPALVSFLWAFTHWNGIGTMSWAGLYNFKSLLFDSDLLWSALGNNLYLMVIPALFVVPIALAIAVLIHRGVWGAAAFRVVLLFPNLLGGIAAILIWLNAYQPHGGLVNAGLVGLGRTVHSGWLQSFADYPWLSDEHLYAALIPIYIWMACGFNLILYLAAMEGIDPQLYEAAEIDGAPPWRQFLTITLPLIREIIAISAVFLVIGGLNAFEMVWLLTSQDPTGPVQTLGTLLVTTMFKNFDIGRAAALAVILFSLVLVGSAGVLRLVRTEPVEN
jgi:ABC-type sugar transport system permease subunit/ABC-type glycerol-3-phosphate transport system substrate-binding protein